MDYEENNLNIPQEKYLTELETRALFESMLLNFSLDKNVNFKKVSGRGNFERNDFHWITLFESIDGYQSAGATVIAGEVTLATNGVLYNEANLLKLPTYNFNQLTWNKDRKLRTQIKFDNTIQQDIHITIGNTGTLEHIGFYIVDNAMYACCCDGSTHNIVNIGTLSAASYAFEIRYTAGAKAEHYVNDVLKATLVNNLPSGINFANRVLYISIKDTGAQVKTLHLSFWDFWQRV